MIIHLIDLSIFEKIIIYLENELVGFSAIDFVSLEFKISYSINFVKLFYNLVLFQKFSDNFFYVIFENFFCCYDVVENEYIFHNVFFMPLENKISLLSDEELLLDNLLFEFVFTSNINQVSLEDTVFGATNRPFSGSIRTIISTELAGLLDFSGMGPDSEF